ncbi:MAG: class I SAM-dependent methyltransferase [Candidatus Heimdallarchaeota archaeon]|nr:class I SAM-dependent methyltransferase [Candidatus Heimdallarchaeota archaeon]
MGDKDSLSQGFESTKRFSTRVENYINFRPHYPELEVEFFKRRLSLELNHSIAEIGSDTGIISQLFLEKGYQVFGVEPNDDMRKAAEELLTNYISKKNFISINATAEKTSLDSQSIDFIIAGQAFHWFAPILFQRESKRILRKNGWSVLIWNSRIIEGDSFHEAYEDFIQKHSTGYKEIHQQWREESDMNIYFDQYEEQTFENFQEVNFTGLLGRYLSSSYAPSSGTKEAKIAEQELQKLFNKHQQNNQVKIIYKTHVYYGQFN